jgi:predicted MPP superfamily phosphohydrolase
MPGCDNGPVPSTRRSVRVVRSVASLAGLGAATLAYSLWEARQYTLRTVDVRLDRPAAGRPGPLRILHLSDLHLSPRDTDRIRWVQSLGRLAPDLTVVTGDFHGDARGPLLALEALRPLLGGPGLYVRGSNDYYAPTPANPAKYLAGPSELRTRRPPIDVTPLDEGLRAAGWHDLDNATTELGAAGWRIDARGVDDPHIGRDRYAQVAGPFDPGAALCLGVAHAPYRRILDPMAADGADLILAGHTHGGQVCLPGFGALVTNCDLPRSRAKGLSEWGGAALHVSAGLGTSPFTPIRLACRPEATLLTLLG